MRHRLETDAGTLAFNSAVEYAWRERASEFFTGAGTTGADTPGLTA